MFFQIFCLHHYISCNTFAHNFPTFCLTGVFGICGVLSFNVTMFSIQAKSDDVQRRTEAQVGYLYGYVYFLESLFVHVFIFEWLQLISWVSFFYFGMMHNRFRSLKACIVVRIFMSKVIQWVRHIVKNRLLNEATLQLNKLFQNKSKGGPIRFHNV